MAAAAPATTSCRALLKALHTKLHGRALHWRRHSFPSSAGLLLLLVLAALLCAAAFARVVVFFLPLVASTSVCCAAVHHFAAAERGAAAEVVLVRGGAAEVGLLQVFDGANASAYGGDGAVQVGCFLRLSVGGGWAKRGVVGEDGEEVVFAGRLAAAAGGHDRAALEEELVALQVDRLAEGVWDTYFGECSRWSHLTAERDVEPEIEQRLS